MTNDGAWGPPPAGSAETPVPPSSTPPAPPGPDVTPEATPPDQPRSRAKLVVGVVAVAALVGAGVFAISRMAGSDAGGAESPEDAVRAFFDALDGEDALGAIDVLLPGERESLRDPAAELVDELRRLEVLSEDADASDVGGIDLQFQLDEVDVSETNVDDIVNVAVSGESSVTVDGEELPIGDLILDNVEIDQSELDTEQRTEEFDLPLTAVRDDGRWYVSAFYTLAETIRREATVEGEALDIPAEGLPAVGGDRPEDAIDNLIDATQRLDVAAIIASLNPDEFEALQRYAPLFLDDAQEAIAEQDDFEISIDDPVYDVSGSGDTRSISIAELHARITGEGEAATIDYADGCWIVAAQEERFDSCNLGDQLPQLDEILDNPEPVQDFLDVAQAAFDDYENPGIIVEQVDGQWYLSPMATAAEQFFALSGALDREEIDELVEAGERAVDATLDESLDFDLGVDSDDFLDPSEGPVDTIEEPVETLTTDVPVTEDATATRAADECYGEIEADAAAACFRTLIDAGEIPAESVEIQMRHPECGLAEAFWAGEYYGLPDAEFARLTAAAAPCFQALLASGELNAGDLPYELSHPQCLEGRNWYTAMSDEDDVYVDRFLDCVSQ